MRIIRTLAILGSTLLTGAAAGEPFPPTDGRTNLAAGKTVVFSPRPDYDLTARGDTDATDLTDGKTVTRPDQKLWFEASAVGWSYPGRASLAVDLETDCDIDEIAIRLQNGGAQGGVLFPGWVEAFVSADGEHYAKVAEFSRWNEGEFEKFGVGRERGRSYADCLRFQNLKARGRFVGLRLYGAELMISDELYVFGKPADANPAPAPESTPSGFTASHPQIYFHKPYLEVATNIALPVPVGMAAPADAPSDAKVSLYLDLPPGLELVGERVGEAAAAAEKGWTRRVFENLDATAGKNPGRGKDALRIYLRATGWTDGQQGELRYGFESGG